MLSCIQFPLGSRLPPPLTIFLRSQFPLTCNCQSIWESSCFFFQRFLAKFPSFISTLARVVTKSLQLCWTLCDPMDYSLLGSLSMGFSSKNTGVGCHARLQGIFPSQGSNPGLHGQTGSWSLVPRGKPVHPYCSRAGWSHSPLVHSAIFLPSSGLSLLYTGCILFFQKIIQFPLLSKNYNDFLLPVA